MFMERRCFERRRTAGHSLEVENLLIDDTSASRSLFGHDRYVHYIIIRYDRCTRARIFLSRENVYALTRLLITSIF